MDIAAEHQEELGSGVTQWVILDSQTGRPMKMQEMFPDGLPFDNKQCISDPFTKMPRDLEWRYLGKHRTLL